MLSLSCRDGPANPAYINKIVCTIGRYRGDNLLEHRATEVLCDASRQRERDGLNVPNSSGVGFFLNLWNWCQPESRARVCRAGGMGVIGIGSSGGESGDRNQKIWPTAGRRNAGSIYREQQEKIKSYLLTIKRRRDHILKRWR
jgi:hypothetical protein